MVIDGKKIAEEVIQKLQAATRPEKFFGALVVGDDPASLNFLKQKERVARELGIDFRLYRYEEGVTTDMLRLEIGRLAGPKTCGGFIVQLPLPDSVNQHYALNAIPKGKDPDFLSEAALGAFYTGRSGLVPPSVATVEEILARTRRDLRKSTVVLIGTGFLIGKPVGFWLQKRVGELVVLDTSIRDIHGRLKDADVVISGAGHPHLFGVEHLKEDALVVDFGFTRLDGKMTGDFDSAGADEKGISYTPTPGGTGPILVAKLFENFYLLNHRPTILRGTNPRNR